MNRMYEIAGHCLCICGEKLCNAVDGIPGFRPFLTDRTDPHFSFVGGSDIPEMTKLQYSFTYEGITGEFGKYAEGFMLVLRPEIGESSFMWCRAGSTVVELSGNLESRHLKFALWIGFGLMTLPHKTIAIHTSCIVYQDKAVLFLGESGTGKSTHTRLWRENIEGAILLNDDSPIIRVEGGKLWAYGSPWSGKTPCYKNERYELKACVRLSQAPHNRIVKLPALHAYGAIHPSCPPEFAYDSSLYNHVGSIISDLLSNIPIYHMECLPDSDAALLAHNTVFSAR